MATYYEWTVEELDEHGDIIDCYFYDRITEIPRHWLDNELMDIGLVWRTGNEDDGETDRAYAYIDRGTMTLSRMFDNGKKVPSRLLAEADRWIR